jgi:hypothetical protein
MGSATRGDPSPPLRKLDNRSGPAWIGRVRGEQRVRAILCGRLRETDGRSHRNGERRCEQKPTHTGPPGDDAPPDGDVVRRQRRRQAGNYLVREAAATCILGERRHKDPGRGRGRKGRR